MKLKFLEDVSGNKGTDEEYRFVEGEVVDFEGDERRAQRWLRRNKAVRTDDDVGIYDDPIVVDPGADYNELTVKQLKGLLKSRGLKAAGTKRDDLIDALELDDAAD